MFGSLKKNDPTKPNESRTKFSVTPIGKMDAFDKPVIIKRKNRKPEEETNYRFSFGDDFSFMDDKIDPPAPVF